EHVLTAGKTEPPADRAIDDDERCGKVRCSLNAMEIQPLVASSAHHGKQDLHHPGFAPGHDCVRCDLLDGGFTVTRRYSADKLGRIESRHHPFNALNSGWNHRQRVSEFADAVLVWVFGDINERSPCSGRSIKVQGF